MQMPHASIPFENLSACCHCLGIYYNGNWSLPLIICKVTKKRQNLCPTLDGFGLLFVTMGS